MKKILVFLLSFVMISCVAKDGLTRREYTRMVRSQIFKANGNDSVSPQMGQRTYTQKTRSQIIKMSEAADTVKTFKGLLINSKIGRGEKATFVIINKIAKDVPYSFTLAPQDTVPVSLPAGEYIVKICCGNYYRESVFHVDPRRKHYFNGQWVYFGIEKNLSDM